MVVVLRSNLLISADSPFHLVGTVRTGRMGTVRMGTVRTGRTGRMGTVPAARMGTVPAAPLMLGMGVSPGCLMVFQVYHRSTHHLRQDKLRPLRSHRLQVWVAMAAFQCHLRMAAGVLHRTAAEWLMNISLVIQLQVAFVKCRCTLSHLSSFPSFLLLHCNSVQLETMYLLCNRIYFPWVTCIVVRGIWLGKRLGNRPTRQFSGMIDCFSLAALVLIKTTIQVSS